MDLIPQLLLNLSFVIADESKKPTVDDPRVYSALDPLLDEIKSGEDLTNHVEECITTLLSVTQLRRWHILQAANFGLCHLVTYSLPKEVIQTVVDHCTANLGDLKREVRECSGQLLGAVCAAHPIFLTSIAPILKANLSQDHQWEACEGSAMATGFCLRSLPSSPIDPIVSSLSSLLDSLTISCCSTSAGSYSTYVRLQSLRALSRIGASPCRLFVTQDTKSTVLLRLGDDDLNVRRLAARAVAMLGPIDVESEEYLLTLAETLSTSSDWKFIHGTAEAIKLYGSIYGSYFKPNTVRVVACSLAEAATCGVDVKPPYSPELLQTLVQNSACCDAIIELITTQSIISEGGQHRVDAIVDPFPHCSLPGAHWVSDLYMSIAKPLLLQFMSSPFPVLNDCAGRSVNSLIKSGLTSTEAFSLIPGLYKLTFHASLPIQDMALRTINTVLKSLDLSELKKLFVLESGNIEHVDTDKSLLITSFCQDILRDLVTISSTVAFNSNPELRECCLKAFAGILGQPISRSLFNSTSFQNYTSSIAPILLQSMNDSYDYVKVAAIRALSKFVIAAGSTLNDEAINFVSNLAVSLSTCGQESILIAVADLYFSIFEVKFSARKDVDFDLIEVDDCLKTIINSELVNGLAFNDHELVRAAHQLVLGPILIDFPMPRGIMSCLSNLIVEKLHKLLEKSSLLNGQSAIYLAYSTIILCNSLLKIENKELIPESVLINCLIISSAFCLSSRVFINSTGLLLANILLENFSENFTNEKSIIFTLPFVQFGFVNILSTLSAKPSTEIIQNTSSQREILVQTLKEQFSEILSKNFEFDSISELYSEFNSFINVFTESFIIYSELKLKSIEEVTHLPVFLLAVELSSTIVHYMDATKQSNLIADFKQIFENIDAKFSNFTTLFSTLNSKVELFEQLNINSVSDLGNLSGSVSSLDSEKFDSNNSSLFLASLGFVKILPSIFLIKYVALCGLAQISPLITTNFETIISSIKMIGSLIEETPLSDDTAFPLAMLATFIPNLTSSEINQIGMELGNIFSQISQDYAIFNSGLVVIDALLLMFLKCCEQGFKFSVEILDLLTQKWFRRANNGSYSLLILSSMSKYIEEEKEIPIELENKIKRALSEVANDEELEGIRGKLFFPTIYFQICSVIGYDLPAPEVLNVRENETFVRNQT
ncbi:hypothetical protein RCL1_002082 [Eukaryota sp. TZLM3-RCL]